MIISRTPFRVSFFGGGTDYAEWYSEHGGAVLTSSIDRYCYISARWLPPFFEHRHRIAWSKIELISNIIDIEHPSVRAVMQHMQVEQGLEVHHSGDLPARSGLGSSSAFTVGLLHAIYALQGRMPGRRLLAEKAIHVERDLMGETVGIQDQIQVAHGGLNMVEIDRGGNWCVEPVSVPRERLRELEAHCLLYFTGISRSASTVAAEQVKAMPENGALLRDMAALVPEAVQVLTGCGPLQEFGRLLDEGWSLKRRLAAGVSTPDIDTLYIRARNAGAVGAKLLGAGGGGFMLLFARPEDQGRLRHALAGVLEVPFHFESEGTRIIYASG